MLILSYDHISGDNVNRNHIKLIILLLLFPSSSFKRLRMGMKRDKKDDEDNGGTGGGHPYSNLEKTSVLQEAR